MEKGTLFPKRTSLPSNRPRVDREDRLRMVVVVVAVGCDDGELFVHDADDDDDIIDGRKAALWRAAAAMHGLKKRWSMMSMDISEMEGNDYNLETETKQKTVDVLVYVVICET